MASGERLPVVLGLDYPGLERRPRLTGLSTQLTVRLVDVLGGRLPQAFTSEEWARELLGRLATPEDEIACVAAFCMAAPIGQDIARILFERTGRVVPVIAVDGAGCPPSFVATSFESLLSRYGDRASTVDVSETSLRQDPAGVLGLMREALMAAATDVLMGDIGDAVVAREIAAELTGAAVDWLRHLIAVHNATYTPWPGPVHLVNSSEAPLWGNWPGASATEITAVECTRLELLGRREVARVINEVAAAPPVTG
ncbi:hypothetical protein ACFQS1_16310 [Paractinoplanes rhizophilus]|jgi:hypothetical protein|uniref:Uncharacterized protein n=1 Tax=Paractinoplanes rhizophilus TaxID=1416877 RepID=A0ABW2HQY7_9ACTN|nr:hypothetical protein [Actinoplanes sp.]